MSRVCLTESALFPAPLMNTVCWLPRVCLRAVRQRLPCAEAGQIESMAAKGAPGSYLPPQVTAIAARVASSPMASLFTQNCFPAYICREALTSAIFSFCIRIQTPPGRIQRKVLSGHRCRSYNMPSIPGFPGLSGSLHRQTVRKGAGHFISIRRAVNVNFPWRTTMLPSLFWTSLAPR